MTLQRLDVRGIRNLEVQSLRELGTVNVFYGANGSGKTSLLEAIHILGLARSFRTAQIKSVISHGQQACTVYGEILDSHGMTVTVGVERQRDGSLDARLAGEPVTTRADLATALPLQIIYSDSFGILTGAPVERRQFLDWGVFHVEHQFLVVWQHFQKAIKQRNSLLRRGKIARHEMAAWDQQFAEAGEKIDAARSAYLETLRPVFLAFLGQLSPKLTNVELSYRRGWEAGKPLSVALEQSLETDQQQGYTHSGPQRADIRITHEGKLANEALSRGQIKLLVCALKLAQGEVLRQTGYRPCIYLVDDLAAELDIEHCRQVVSMLSQLEVQQFVTCIQRKDVNAVWQDAQASELTMFHVEHGRVQRESD